MKIDQTKEWFDASAKIEGEAEVGAGLKLEAVESFRSKFEAAPFSSDQYLGNYPALLKRINALEWP